MVATLNKELNKTGSVNVKDVFLDKRDVRGKMVALLDFVEERPGVMDLIAPSFRAVLTNEIHELTLTDEQSAVPGKIVNRERVIGFIEIETGGIVRWGDEVTISDRFVGNVAGFGVAHMPNHMNIVIKVQQLVNPGLRLEDEVIIAKRAHA